VGLNAVRLDPDERLEHLRSGLRHVGRLVATRVELPVSRVTYWIDRPEDTDLLLDATVDDPEQNLPYWSEIWPSGVALADAICADPSPVVGRRVLELGCGIGITAIAALRAGCGLVVSDYSDGALRLCQLNCLINADMEPASIQFNWRDPSDEFLALVGDGLPVILAADVLYERRDIEPLLDLLNRIMLSDGLLWLAEPGRHVARQFVERAVDDGWSVADEQRFEGPWPDAKDAGVKVTVRQLRRRV
jgi:predicted nicotinamide N-methyase